MLLFVTSNFSFSQTVKVDSLKLAIENQQDTVKINSYLQLSEIFFTELGDIDSMRYFSLIALNQSKKAAYIKGGIKALGNIGIYYALTNEYKKSIQYWDEGIKYAILTKDKANIADLEGKLGYSYQMMDNYEEATQHFLKAASMFEELKDYNELANVYQNIASVFATQEPIMTRSRT